MLPEVCDGLAEVREKFQKLGGLVHQQLCTDGDVCRIEAGGGVRLSFTKDFSFIHHGRHMVCGSRKPLFAQIGSRIAARGWVGWLTVTHTRNYDIYPTTLLPHQQSAKKKRTRL
jgi:hypothetical protein